MILGFVHRCALLCGFVEGSMQLRMKHVHAPTGFGAVTVLPVLLLPFYMGTGVMALLFPLFMLVATDAHSQGAQGQGMR